MKYKQHVETPRPSAPGVSFRKLQREGKAEGFHIQRVLFLFISRESYTKKQFLTASFNRFSTKTNYCIYSVKCYIFFYCKHS